MVFKGLATQSVLGIPPRASPAKAGLNQIMQSLNPLLWHGSWAVSVAGCTILLSSTYLKVSPGASRRDEDSFVSETLHEQLREMFGRLRCACTEQTSGRRRAEELRRREEQRRGEHGGAGDCARGTLLQPQTRWPQCLTWSAPCS